MRIVTASVVRAIVIMFVCGHSNLVLAESNKSDGTQLKSSKDETDSAFKVKVEQTPQTKSLEDVESRSPQKVDQSASAKKGTKNPAKRENLHAEDSLDAQTVLDLDEVPSRHIDLCDVILPSGRHLRDENHKCPPSAPKVK